MKKDSFPTYSTFQKMLDDKLHPSQVHGLICGVLCVNTSSIAWEGLLSTGKKLQAKVRALLKELHQMSKQQLEEFLFEFELLLPEDENLLPQRAEALKLWCQGFLTGLKLMQIPLEKRPPSDVTEAINDLIEIARMNDEVIASTETAEEDEANYAELVEYVRIAVILIYQDLQEESTSLQSNSSIH
jgi:uncharacterized protein